MAPKRQLLLWLALMWAGACICSAQLSRIDAEAFLRMAGQQNSFRQLPVSQECDTYKGNDYIDSMMRQAADLCAGSGQGSTARAFASPHAEVAALAATNVLLTREAVLGGGKGVQLGCSLVDGREGLVQGRLKQDWLRR